MYIYERIKTILFIYSGVICLPGLGYSQFGIVIKNKDKSIHGSRVKTRSIPYRRIVFPGKKKEMFFYLSQAQPRGQPMESTSYFWFELCRRRDGQTTTLNFSVAFYRNEFGERVSAVSGDYFIVTAPGEFVLMEIIQSLGQRRLVNF